MSPKNPLLTVGLTALGLLGAGANLFAGPDDPPAGLAPPSAPAPAAPAPAAGASRALLLYSGQILQGECSEEGTDYLVRQKGGEIRLKKDRVEGAFESIAGVYEYKLGQVSDRDPDEHLKLAKWCLERGLNAEAKERLQAVLKLSPKAREARAMLASIEGAETRVARAKEAGVDAAVMQSSAEVTVPVAPKGAGRPFELDAAVIRKATRELGVSGLPVIFDLPPAQAVKRSDEFAWDVLPVLQASCLRCHNERYEGAFQLVELRSKRDRNSEALRANLDAVLQFIDRDQPSKSELLATVLLPHGGGANPRPVFRGANDPRFQILAAWVSRLKPAKGGGKESGAAARLPQREREGGAAFGVDRGNGPGPLSYTPTPEPIGPTSRPGDVLQRIPSSRYVPGKGMAVEKLPPAPEDFPLPFAAGGPGPVPASKAKAEKASSRKGAGGASAEAAVVAEGSAAALPELPPAGADEATDPEDEAPAEPVKAAKPKAAAKVKIDPALLEKALQNRNSTR